VPFGGAHGGAERRHRAGVAELVAGEAERVEGRRARLVVASPARGLERMLSQRRRRPRVGIDHRVGCLRESQGLGFGVHVRDVYHGRFRVLCMRRIATVSPILDFPANQAPDNAITERVLQHPRVTYDVNGDVLVIALRDELLVRRTIRMNEPKLDRSLSDIGHNCGSLADVNTQGPHDEVEVWRLGDDKLNAIDEARRLRGLVDDEVVPSPKGSGIAVPAVSPNHVLVVSKYTTCPAGPPHPTPAESAGWIELPDAAAPRARVVAIDTGYVTLSPPNAELDARVSLVAGQWFDTSVTPGVWRDSDPDLLDADGDGHLDGVAGHGTFVAGEIANRCRQCDITMIGLRHESIVVAAQPDPTDQARLFTSELAVAGALIAGADADVIACGFSYPTLDGYGSIAFSAAMQILRGRQSPRPDVAVVAPAGNESAGRPHWPAAHPDVIGVAAVNRRGTRRADFSNWGPWADCCAGGEDVTSTFIRWDGPIEGEPATNVEHFDGWARWDGTSFAAPKVTAEIARLVAESGGALRPVDAAAQLISGMTAVVASPMTDTVLFPFPGVTLPHLRLG
jgi:hypothetical protein